MRIRKTNINPFLMNPIKAIVRNEDCSITHCTETNRGLICVIECKDGKTSQADLNDVEFLNTHEFDRFKAMLQVLAQKQRISSKWKSNETA